ncbi:MAG: hypothetical protein CMD83_03345 [Gammaproteobacteria bacterium]|nr:hypothetical protein [Gammaproteobacteria bacterium]
MIQRSVTMIPSHRPSALAWVAALLGALICQASGEEGAGGAPVPLLSEEELTNYPFSIPVDETPPKVEEMSVGEQFILDSQRSDIEDLVARKLGVLYMKRSREDLPTLQRLVDGGHIPTSRTKDWQSLGIVFGDILAEELDLRWVIYEDELGKSRALQFGKTLSFVFPVTMFSKRVQFGQSINIPDVYRKVEAEVAGFAAHEAAKVRYADNERRLRGDGDEDYLPPDP